MAKRFGAVIKARPGVPREAMITALASLTHLLDLPDVRWDDATNRLVRLDPDDVMARATAAVETFDDAHGGPVWYIP